MIIIAITRFCIFSVNFVVVLVLFLDAGEDPGSLTPEKYVLGHMGILGFAGLIAIRRVSKT